MKPIIPYGVELVLKKHKIVLNSVWVRALELVEQALRDEGYQRSKPVDGNENEFFFSKISNGNIENIDTFDSRDKVKLRRHPTLLHKISCSLEKANDGPPTRIILRPALGGIEKDGDKKAMAAIVIAEKIFMEHGYETIFKNTPESTFV